MVIENILVEIEPSECKFPNPVKVLWEHRVGSFIGTCNLRKVESKLYADFNIDDEAIKTYPLVDGLNNLTPSLGLQSLELADGSKGDWLIHVVGLCSNPNVDERIKSIGEQLK